MNQVFVLGAGASKDAVNAPLGVDLVWSADVDAHGIVGKTDIKRFVQLATHYDPNLKHLEARLAEPEQLFIPHDVLNKRHYVDEFLSQLQQDGRQDDVQFVRNLIFRHIIGAIFDNYGCTVDPSKSTKYEWFVRDILGPAATNDTVTVISFNFDTALHEDFQQGVYFDYCLEFDQIDCNRGKSYKPTAGISLLKLNGSFDWAMCQKCHQLELVFCWQRSDFYDQPCPIRSCGGRRYPLVVLPHEVYGHRFDRLWDNAGKALNTADKITVIGYSFPVYDSKVRNLFTHSVRRGTKLEIVDYAFPGEEVAGEDRIRRLYSELLPGLKSPVAIMLNGFGDYLACRNNIVGKDRG